MKKGDRWFWRLRARPDWRDATRCKNPKCQFTLGRYEKPPFCASCWSAGRWGAGVMFVVGAIAETVRMFVWP